MAQILRQYDSNKCKRSRMVLHLKAMEVKCVIYNSYAEERCMKRNFLCKLGRMKIKNLRKSHKTLQLRSTAFLKSNAIDEFCKKPTDILIPIPKNLNEI